jgi:hypothetical protein
MAFDSKALKARSIIRLYDNKSPQVRRSPFARKTNVITLNEHDLRATTKYVAVLE